MLDSNGGERTLIGAILPPKTAHIDSINSIVFKDILDLLEFSGLSSSLSFDFYIKTVRPSNLHN